MFKIKSLTKSCVALLVCAFIVGLSCPSSAFAAGEPGNGSYKIKCVGTGSYINVSNGQISVGSANTTFKIEDTEPSPSVKWFSITSGSSALSFSNKDAKASLVSLIPGSLNYGDSNYAAYKCQRFTFGKVASGYNIRPVAFGNNTDNRVLTVENGTLCLKKANGSKNQVFTLEK